MGLRTPTGSGWSAVAMTLAASLTGAPQALCPTFEPEHRCHCPAGVHVCSCPRCAAKARRAAAQAAQSPGHGPAAASAAGASASRQRPPCHGGAVAAPPGEEDAPPPADAACLSAACGGAGAVAMQPGGVDPFVVQEHRARVQRGRPEGFPPIASLTSVDPSAPEPPPPRA